MWNRHPDYYKWVYPEMTKRWGCSEENVTPYCYRTLLKLVCPHYFGIYQNDGNIIQVNPLSIVGGTMEIKELSITQLSSFIYTETYRLHRLFPEGCLGRTIFNNEMFSKRDYPIKISQS